MALTFYISSDINQRVNAAYLLPNSWDDYHFKTLFNLVVFNEEGDQVEIGDVKIGYLGQDAGWTKDELPPQFDALTERFFSLGQDVDYYQNLVSKLSPEVSSNILTSLGDVVHDVNRFNNSDDEGVFLTSLLRTVHITSIENQFRRVLRDEVVLTDYDFFYEKEATEEYSGVKVEFSVSPETKPSSNIHILIGRNGVGKTTLLNNMVDALLPDRGDIVDTGAFYQSLGVGNATLNDNYFAGVVSVSFSAFDPFEYPEDQNDAGNGMQYHYVGLRKDREINGERIKALKNEEELTKDFISSLKVCITMTAKKERWTTSIKKLESDSNFEEMDLCRLIDIYNNDESDNKTIFSNQAENLFSRMSSGHAIVLLTITKLVETVEEKTLLLLDEPESHLHPPLLSAFTRALSDLLVNRNGVAIIATHSPVVLQEVPKSCVSILRRMRLEGRVERPENETFAENVGVLTREVFGLEVSKSGFHDLLTASVNEGKSYEEIEHDYHNQLGFEGKVILRSLIASRDARAGTE